MAAAQWIVVTGVVQPGHRVASGQGGDPRYPDGTLRLQFPKFAALGLDLTGVLAATLNVSIQPRRWIMHAPRFVFKAVSWTTHHPPEDFSFSRCEVVFEEHRSSGWIYYPHPGTKKDHFQDASMIEVLAPRIPNIKYGAAVQLWINANEVVVEP